MSRSAASRQLQISPAAIQSALEAAYSGGLEEVEQFVNEQSGDINLVKDDHDRTLLHCLLARPFIAAQEPIIVRLCEHILARGANPNAVSKTGVCPLHVAAISGNAAACKLLVAKGANVDTISTAGDTPLILAARAGKGEAVDALMFAGADPRTPNAITARTAYQEAVDRGHNEVAEMIQFCVEQLVKLEANLAPVVHHTPIKQGSTLPPLSTTPSAPAPPIPHVPVTHSAEDPSLFTIIPAADTSPSTELPPVRTEFDDDSFNPFSSSPVAFDHPETVNVKDDNVETDASSFPSTPFGGQDFQQPSAFTESTLSLNAFDAASQFDNESGFGSTATFGKASVSGAELDRFGETVFPSDQSVGFGFSAEQFEASFENPFSPDPFQAQPQPTQQSTFAADFDTDFSAAVMAAADPDTDGFATHFAQMSFAEDFGSTSPKSTDLEHESADSSVPATEEILEAAAQAAMQKVMLARAQRRASSDEKLPAQDPFGSWSESAVASNESTAPQVSFVGAEEQPHVGADEVIVNEDSFDPFGQPVHEVEEDPFSETITSAPSESQSLQSVDAVPEEQFRPEPEQIQREPLSLSDHDVDATFASNARSAPLLSPSALESSPTLSSNDTTAEPVLQVVEDTPESEHVEDVMDFANPFTPVASVERKQQLQQPEESTTGFLLSVEDGARMSADDADVAAETLQLKDGDEEEVPITAQEGTFAAPYAAQIQEVASEHQVDQKNEEDSGNLLDFGESVTQPTPASGEPASQSVQQPETDLLLL